MTKRIVLIFVIVIGFAPLYAQPDRSVVTLAKDPAGLFKSYKFFIQNVEDQRPQPGAALGKVIAFGKEIPAVLPGKVETELFDYWSFIAPKKEQTYLPLYITVKELSVNEKRVGPNRVTGEVRLNVRFRWYRNMQPVELTGYQTAANYTRPETAFTHDKLVKQLVDQALSHFHKWMTTNAGKTPALARNLVLAFKEINNTASEDTVFYSPKRPLVWDDFKVRSAKPGSRYAAAVFTSFGYEGRSYPKDDDLVVEIGLKIFMVKSMSWGRPESRNAGTLRHEQIHFDITRLVAEKFKERLRKAELTIEDYDSEIQYQFLEAFREMNRDQERYDGETGHGLNAGTQAAWDKKIARQIEALYSVQ
ncbi:hypothetical protein [Dyadobacter sp. 676]|uniref:DUF922 domain-containing protein n=1 Tax=Dyadobacter sp. 676 TaxID=3088362 RepID=A0AAU8FK66_9BACT